MTPAEIILRKRLVSSLPGMTREELSKLKKEELDKLTDLEKYGVNTTEWMKIKIGIRDRAFFSSRVESTKFLETCRKSIADMLDFKPNEDGAITSRAEVVSRIMQAARDTGISTGSGGMTDPGSMARANVIIDTNAGMAAGYVQAVTANTYGARLAFPAQELVRIEERSVHRPWREIWKNHGGKIYPGNRMIALKDDPIWIAISRFETPYPPFDFNSGMGIEDVSYDEAVALKVIDEDYQPKKVGSMENFNAGMKADLQHKNDETFERLKRDFGDQIRFNGDSVEWRHDVVKEAFLSKRHFELDLGVAPDRMTTMLPTDELKSLTRGKEFVIDSKWLPRKRKNRLDHYSHFEDPITHLPRENEENNIPLKADDLEYLPTIFREPDKVYGGKTATSFINVLYDGDGSQFCLVLDAKKDIRVKTFLKLKPGVDVEKALNE